MTQLSVNLNKIALIRNARGRNFPSVEYFGTLALQAGAHGLTVHPRPDERHAKFSDLPVLKKLVQTYGAELNVEGHPSERFVQAVLHLRPHQCTLVPDAPDQITSDHGYDLRVHGASLVPIIQKFREQGIRTSIFMDPVPEHMKLAKEIGADRIELYTEAFAQAASKGEVQKALVPYVQSAQAAAELGLGINAGHDLNLDNLGILLEHIPFIAEVSIGHALTVESLLYGWTEVIRKYVRICRSHKEEK